MRASTFRSYSCHVTSSTPTAAVFFSFPQTVFVHVVQQGREFEHAVLAGRSTHALQPVRLSLIPALRPVGVGLLGVPLG